MKIYFKQKYYKMWKTMEVGDCANVCFQTAKRLVAEGVASYEEVDKVILEILGEKDHCDYCDESVEDDHICYTCCGNEITGEVEDLGLCPTCLEHI